MDIVSATSETNHSEIQILVLSALVFALYSPLNRLDDKYSTYTSKTPGNGKYGRHRRKPRTKWVSLLDFYEQIKMAYRRSMKQLCYGTLILVAELFLCLKISYKCNKNHYLNGREIETKKYTLAINQCTYCWIHQCVWNHELMNPFFLCSNNTY